MCTRNRRRGERGNVWCAGGEGRVGGRGLTYRGLTSSRLTRRCPSDERTSAARRIYERFSTILLPWKIVIARVLRDDVLPFARLFRSNFRTIFSTYRFIKWFVPTLSARPSNRSSIHSRCSNVWASHTYKFSQLWKLMSHFFLFVCKIDYNNYFNL